jgi:hypothetical protein
MAKIETLTPGQWDQVRVIRDEYYQAGICTYPADRPAAESAIADMYAAIGRDRPRFVWVASPAAAVLAIDLVRRDSDSLRTPLGDSLRTSLGDSLRTPLRASLGDSLGDSLWASLGDSLRDSLRASLGASLGDSLRASLRASLGASLRASLWDSLRASLWDSLWDSLRASLRDSLGDSLRDSLGGQHEYWIALYDGTRRLGLIKYDTEETRHLDMWSRIAKSCGWWWPYDGMCIISERPEVVRMEPWPGRGEAARRLHCPDGPALRYRDGWEVYSWHGTQVPKELITGGWSTDDILRQPNAEVRRCAIEHRGWDRFIAEAGLKQIGEPVPDPGNPGQHLTLYDVPENIYGNAEVRVMLCTNGTPERDGTGTRRRFGLTVPASVPNPIAAAAWGYDDPDHPVRVTPENYAQLARRK